MHKAKESPPPAAAEEEKKEVPSTDSKKKKADPPSPNARGSPQSTQSVHLPPPAETISVDPNAPVWITLPLISLATAHPDQPQAPQPTLQVCVKEVHVGNPVKAIQEDGIESKKALLNISLRDIKHVDGEGRDPLVALFAKNPESGVWETESPVVRTERAKLSEGQVTFTKQVTPGMSIHMLISIF